MGNVNFGALTTPKKANFNIQNGNQKAQGLVTQYNKEWSVFEAAKKAAEGAQNGAETPNVSMASIETDLENAIAKLEKYEAEIAKASADASKNDAPESKEDKEKVKGKNLNSMG